MLISKSLAKLHANKRAITGKKYVDRDGTFYIGTKEKRLEKFVEENIKDAVTDVAEEIVENNTANIVNSIVNNTNNITNILISGGAIVNSFETVSKNLKDYDNVLAYDMSGNLDTVTYTVGASTIVKTFSYDMSGNLTSVVLSGAGLPAGINTTKTFSYTGDDLTGIAYS